jgi:hypothetical protein
VTISYEDRNHPGMKRHDFIVHYVIQNPFEQFVYRVRLNASERRKLEREFIRGLRAWTIHSYRIEEAELPAVGLSAILEELDDLRTGSK